LVCGCEFGGEAGFTVMVDLEEGSEEEGDYEADWG